MQQSAARLLAAVAVACVALVAPSAHAQTGSGSGAAVPSCAAKLVPCAGYLNSTSTSAAPAAACCGPLREAAANETACLCSMLLNKAALRAFGVAPEQGLLLAKRCNVTTDASACSAAGAGASTGGSTAASSASTGSTSSSVTKPTANGGGVVARPLSFTGAASSLVGLSFIWWMIMA